MRIRYKKWARPELEASPFYVDNPEEERGKWRKLYKNPTLPLYLELGCGKGYFIANLASEHKDVNYIAIDLVDAMLGLAKRNVEQIYKEKNQETDNIFLTRFDIERINLILSDEDKIDRIYINFFHIHNSNPPLNDTYFSTFVCLCQVLLLFTQTI